LRFVHQILHRICLCRQKLRLLLRLPQHVFQVNNLLGVLPPLVFGAEFQATNARRLFQKLALIFLTLRRALSGEWDGERGMFCLLQRQL
jgi:hypothetical protein